MKRLAALLCVLILLFVAAMTCAAAPTDSFTRKNEPGGEQTTVRSREAFTASREITADTLGLEEPL